MKRRHLATRKQWKASRAFTDYKRRLHGVLQLIGGSGATREVIAARLNAADCRVSRSTVTRWMDASSKPVPDSYQLMVIARLARDISLDWLIGTRSPQSMTEQFIETQLKRRGSSRKRA